MANYDLPADLNYILAATNAENLTYVGHSQGTMMFFAFFGDATNPASPAFHLASKINKFVALAPVAYLGDLTAPFLHALAHIPGLLDELVLGDKGTFEDNEWIVTRLPIICHLIPEACEDVLCLFAGCQSTSNYNETRIPFLLSEYPAGTSVQNLLHFAQGVDTDNFQYYDYPTDKENELHYNQTTPPYYTVANFHIPTLLYHGGRDKLADPQDVAKLLAQLGTPPETLELIPQFGHGDFVWGLDAHELIYAPVIELLK